jgi:hypothetical protein
MPVNSSLSQSNELLMIAASSTSPMPSGENSHSGSLGASVSDLSSDAHSELSDNAPKTQVTMIQPQQHQQQQRKSSIPSLPKTFSATNVSTSQSGTSTPTRGSSGVSSNNTSSRLPVPNKTK